jgi:hypothetical protein
LGIGTYVAVCIVLGTLGGRWLDGQFDTGNLLTVVGLFLGHGTPLDYDQAKGTDEAVTTKLWRDSGLRVIPGHYLARDGANGRNPGTGYVRVALVQDKETTAEALHRLVAVLG